MSEIRQLLHDEIKEDFEALSEIEIGTEEYKASVEGLTKLVDRAIEMDRLDADIQDKAVRLKEDKTDRLIKNILTGLGIVIPTGVTIWGALKTWEFEETGTVASLVGKGFMNKLFSRK